MTIKLDGAALILAAKEFDAKIFDRETSDDALKCAIAAYLENMPDEDEPAPEGVEFDMHVYIHSPKADASTRLAFPGNVLRPPPSVPVNVRELIETLAPAAQGRLFAIANDWRVMTRAEIQGYKLRSMGVEVRALDS